MYRDKFKDKQTPDRVEDILAKAEQAPPQTVKTEEIERSIAESLDPRDAAVVRGDLELLSLLLFPPPAIDAFDYWGKLTGLVEGLRVYASNNRLFELQGVKDPKFGPVLYLPKASKVILTETCAANLCIPDTRQTLKSVECFALLRKEGKGFPIVVGVSADFNQYSSIGGPPGLENAQCPYCIETGQQRHWLKFEIWSPRRTFGKNTSTDLMQTI